MDTLHDVMKTIVAFRDERDWAQFHTPRNLAAALAIETAELQETMLWKSDAEVQTALADPAVQLAVRREIADVFIYSLLLCDAVGVDPAEAIYDKLGENARKYPVSLARGNALKYDRLSP